jgi:hypothetical protein
MRKNKYIVVKQLFLKSEIKDVLLEETHLFFSRKEDAKKEMISEVREK